jgi:hypothetical protein
MDIIGLIVNAVSGAIGGNALGVAWKDKSLGAIGNTIAGLIGGVAGSYILQAIGILSTLGLDQLTVGQLLGHTSAGFVGGGILTAIVGLIKNAISKKTPKA